jgi:hypothetical protein
MPNDKAAGIPMRREGFAWIWLGIAMAFLASRFWTRILAEYRRQSLNQG